MKKLSWILALSLFSISVAAQVPPLYDSEELPSDLAIESKRRAPPKKKVEPKKEETEAPPATTAAAPKVEASTGTVTQTKQQVPAAPIELPGSSQPTPVEPVPAPTTAPVPAPVTAPVAPAPQVPAPAAPVPQAPTPIPAPTPAPIPAPAVPSIPSPTPEMPAAEIPADIPSEIPAEVPVMAAPAMAEAPSDGGPQRDAGNDLTTAMTLSFARYSDNFLSTQDTVDMFKIYARAGESLGVILTPEHPSMQLSVDLLGETGELLTQTQASQPGAPLSFQTSALGANTTIYIQVRDTNLIVQGTAAPELRKYALELRPILAAPTPPIPVPSAESPETAQAPEEKPAQQEEEPTEETSLFAGFFDEPSVFYGAIGIGVLLILLVILMVIRKMRGRGEEEEEEKEEEQHDQQNDGNNP